MWSAKNWISQELKCCVVQGLESEMGKPFRASIGGSFYN